MKKFTAALLATSLLATSACQSTSGGSYGYDQNQNTYAGAGIGAIIGAAAGAAVAENKWGGAAAGAAIGGLAGAGIGQYMDQQEAAMRKELENSGVQVQRQGNDILLNMPNSITFAFNSSEVKSEFNSTVTDIANVLNQYPETSVQVIGHTDDVGSDAFNQTLSEKRADAVASKLIANGVVNSRLVGIGRGESQPVADNKTEAGRAANRRVEVRITPTQQPAQQ
jgi:outer membrane protein OmpA-like peptidoglycan-associated protein